MRQRRFDLIIKIAWLVAFSLLFMVIPLLRTRGSAEVGEEQHRADQVYGHSAAGPEDDLPPDAVTDPSVGYEEHDMSTGTVVVFGGALAIMVLAVLLVSAGLFGFLANGAGSASAPALGPVATQAPPPIYNLEVAPAQSMQDLRAYEDKLLTGYSWVDRSNNIVRIPIDRAMDLILQEGLPARNPGTGSK